MLDDFSDSQSLACSILNNAISNNKISHAYLFESNENPDTMKFVLSFAKTVICNGLTGEEKKNICNRIDDGNYIDIKIIDSDGIWIKKEELINLQNEFSKKAIEGSKKIYIINEAEKMNVQTANSILKFLEEPVDDIIAILIVNNINLVLPTIISRCQIIRLNKKIYTESSVDNFYYLFSNSKYGKISSDEANSIISNVLNFACFVEKNGLDSIIYSKKIWHNEFKDRENSIIAMELLINLYSDCIRYKSNLEINFYRDKKDIVEEIVSYNSLDDLIKKVDILIETKNNLKRNLNINLVIDKLIIDMCGD